MCKRGEVYARAKGGEPFTWCFRDAYDDARKPRRRGPRDLNNEAAGEAMRSLATIFVRSFARGSCL